MELNEILDVEVVRVVLAIESYERPIKEPLALGVVKAPVSAVETCAPGFANNNRDASDTH